ncbi:MAG: hypothetical protein VSS75_007215 [Candidatus Parabeggiatoa sp.]|nr:hypothetical protein [Candidatus Parabeggiatoa sp.]
MRSKSYAKLSLVVLLGTLGLGLSSVAKADMKWFETARYSCPTVCQKNAEYKYNKENAAYKFAVPSGTHSVTGKTFYICATNYAGTGWRGGYNIEWKGMSDSCFAQWIRMNSGKNSYGEHYFCLCTDQEIPPITNDMVRY